MQNSILYLALTSRPICMTSVHKRPQSPYFCFPTEYSVHEAMPKDLARYRVSSRRNTGRQHSNKHFLIDSLYSRGICWVLFGDSVHRNPHRHACNRRTRRQQLNWIPCRESPGWLLVHVVIRVIHNRDHGNWILAKLRVSVHVPFATAAYTYSVLHTVRSSTR